VAISEAQLTTWAEIGAQTTSKDTYATVKLALESNQAGYYGKDVEIFLQGSYGNDTNIWKESDVDIVIKLRNTFSYDISGIPADQQAAFNALMRAAYDHNDFKRDVLKVLRARFGQDVDPGNKAVAIKANGNRRKADVLVALEHHNYSRYGPDGGDFVTGISFYKADGTFVANYPRKHRENLVAKNQATNEWFKHIIRIYKNARQRMIAEGLIGEGIAPSYYIEGLLYNVPNDQFGASYVNSVVNSLNWLLKAKRDDLACANMQYWLLRGPADVTWNVTDCEAYLNAWVQLWNAG
jgi:hypothetical protein